MTDQTNSHEDPALAPELAGAILSNQGSARDASLDAIVLATRQGEGVREGVFYESFDRLTESAPRNLFLAMGIASDWIRDRDKKQDQIANLRVENTKLESEARNRKALRPVFYTLNTIGAILFAKSLATMSENAGLALQELIIGLVLLSLAWYIEHRGATK